VIWTTGGTEVKRLETTRRLALPDAASTKNQLPKRTYVLYLLGLSPTPLPQFRGGIQFAMARITVEDCLNQIGDENRFSLIHLAVTRVKQHRQGTPMLVKGKNKELVMTLREIAAGKVTFANIKMIAPGEQKSLSKAEPEVAVIEPAKVNV
jgi:DNA-directed RNA polymerase subunit omega